MIECALMSLLDSVTSQTSFRDYCSRIEILLRGGTYARHAFSKGTLLYSTGEVSVQMPRKVNFTIGHLKMQGALVMKAVATHKPQFLVQSGQTFGLTTPSGTNSNPQVSQDPSEDFAENNEREKLRRERISKANKGNVPWNKGRKHSPVTIQRIRERTKQAMHEPKVKVKLSKSRNIHSAETKEKIRFRIRTMWQEHREKLKAQELCIIRWQDLIAEASRKGYAGEKELQCNSYEMRKQEAAHWTVEMDRVLCELLIYQVLLGNRPNSFEESTWDHVREKLNRRTKRYFSMQQIKERYNALRIIIKSCI